MKKDKCKYCGITIESGYIRCDTCDSAWQEGFNDGKQSFKHKLQEMYSHLVNLISD